MAKKARKQERRQKRKAGTLGYEDVRTCFVIMPYGKKPDPGSKHVVDFDAIYKTIIAPTIKGLNDDDLKIECERADEVERAGFIHERMIQTSAPRDGASCSIAQPTPSPTNPIDPRRRLAAGSGERSVASRKAITINRPPKRIGDPRKPEGRRAWAQITPNAVAAPSR